MLLTDARGVILGCVTASMSAGIFERAGLWLGADWSGPAKAPAASACLVERQSLTIHRDEHFRGRRTGLACSASPVFDPRQPVTGGAGCVLGQEAVSRQSQFHTMALVNLSAKMIPSCYFLRHFENQWLLRFHLQAESVGPVRRGVAGVRRRRAYLCGQPGALNLLGQVRGSLLGQPVEALFECSLDQLLGRASANATASWPLRTRDGRHLFAALRGQPRGIGVPAPLPSCQATTAARYLPGVTRPCKTISVRR